LRLELDGADGLDFSRFTDEELDWFGQMIERISDRTASLAGHAGLVPDRKED
jgi:hypothetical protein